MAEDIELTNLIKRLSGDHASRCTTEEKDRFLSFVASAYPCHSAPMEEIRSFPGKRCRNLVFGDPEKADRIYAAYYSGVRRCFFPFTEFRGKGIYNILQFLFYWSLLLSMVLLMRGLFHYNLPVAFLIWIILCYMSSFAFPLNSRLSVSNLTVMYLLMKREPSSCYVFLDNPGLINNGLQAFLKKHGKGAGNKTVLIDRMMFGGVLLAEGRTPPPLDMRFKKSSLSVSYRISSGAAFGDSVFSSRYRDDCPLYPDPDFLKRVAEDIRSLGQHIG